MSEDPPLTIEEVNKTSPTLIRVFERERLLKEQAEARSRFAPQVKDENTRSPLIAVTAAVVREAMRPRSTQAVEAADTYTLHAGRISIRDAAKHFGWTCETPLSFSISNDEITVTACVSESEEGTFMDTQQRVVVPVSARNRFELRNGENVFVITAKAPIAHVSIVPMSHLLAGYFERKQTP